MTIPNGPYDLDTLAAALQTCLNSGMMAGLGNYSVTRRGTSASTATATLARAYQIDLTWVTFIIPPEVGVISGLGNPRVEPRSPSQILSFPSAAFANSDTSN